MNLVGVMESQNSARMFLVRSHMSNFLICIIDPNGKWKIENENSVKHFRTFIRETFKSMEQSQQDYKDYDLWIPNFKTTCMSNKIIEETWKPTKDQHDHLFSGLELHLESTSDGELIKRQAGDKSIVLSEGFAVGLIDTAHEDKLDIPVFSALVTKDCFIQSPN